jgi:hypothetical protein
MRNVRKLTSATLRSILRGKVVILNPEEMVYVGSKTHLWDPPPRS